MKRVLDLIGARDVGEIKRIERDENKEGEMILVKLGNEEQKKELMERKFKLRGRRERIMEDWTWKDEMEVGGNSKSGGGERKLRMEG